MVIIFQVAYSSPHYGGQRVGGSPQAAASPHLSASPQVPSPQGQTLDLSVSRLSHRLVLGSVHYSENRRDRIIARLCLIQIGTEKAE